MSLLAHAGGWDELLIAVGAIAVIAIPRMIVERRRSNREEPDAPEDTPQADAPEDREEARRP